MNQKNIKILLLAAVAGIWGIVLYKVFTGINNDEVQEKIQQPKVKLAEKDTISTFELLADYDDPFGADGSLMKEEIVSSNSEAVNNSVMVASTIPVSPPDLSFIKYEGMLLNEVTKKKTAILALNGKEIMLPVGKSIANVQLLEVQKSKIRIKYFNGIYWVKRSN